MGHDRYLEYTKMIYIGIAGVYYKAISHSVRRCPPLHASAKPDAQVQSCAVADAVYGCWQTHASIDCDAAGEEAPKKHSSHTVALKWSEYVPTEQATAVPTASAS